MDDDPVEQAAGSILARLRSGEVVDDLAELDPRVARAALGLIGEYDSDLLAQLAWDAVQAVRAIEPAAGAAAPVTQLSARRYKTR